MQLLVEMQVFILAMRGQLLAAVAALFQPVQPTTHHKYLSVASLWKIVVKTGFGKLDIPVPVDKAGDLARHLGLDVLPVTVEHAVTDLNVLPPHRRSVRPAIAGGGAGGTAPFRDARPRFERASIGAEVLAKDEK